MGPDDENNEQLQQEYLQQKKQLDDLVKIADSINISRKSYELAIDQAEFPFDDDDVKRLAGYSILSSFINLCKLNTKKQ